MKTSKSADNEMLTWFCVNKEQILKQVLVFISLRTDKGSADGLIMLHSGQDGDECEANGLSCPKNMDFIKIAY